MATKKPYIAQPVQTVDYDALMANLNGMPGATLEQASSRGLLRGAADLGLEAASGAAKGIKFMSDVFGADNPVSQGLQGVSDFAKELQSAQAKGEDQRIAQLMKEAEDKGIGEQVKAALRAAGEAPVRQAIGAIGTSVPMIAASMVPGLREASWGTRAAALGGMGGAQGVGVVKSSMYDAVYQRAIEEGRSEQEARALAQQAQAYSPENAGDIALGGVLGVGAALTGFEPAAARAVGGAAAKTAATKAAQRGLMQSTLRGTLAEAIPEATQGFQEQVAGNRAEQRAGFDTPTFRGAAGSATLEGLLSAPGGAVGGMLDARGAKPAPKLLADQIRATESVPETGPMTRAANQAVEAKAQQVEMTADAEGAALAAMEKQAQDDLKGLRDFAGRSSDVVAGMPVAGAQPAVPGAEPSAEFIDSPFLDRIQTVQEMLADPATREKVRARWGDEGLNNIAYYAGMANRTGLPEKTQDNLLGMAERLLSESVLTPIQPAPELGGMRRDPLTLGNQPQPATQALGMDGTPSGRFTVDPQGNVAPESRVQAMEAQRRAEEAASLGKQTPRGQAQPEATMQGTLGIGMDTAPTGRLLAGQDGVRPETRMDAINIGQADMQRQADAAQRAEVGLTPDIEAVQQRNAMRPLDGDILNPSGKPFKTLMAAQRAAKKSPGEIVEVTGGFAIRPATMVAAQPEVANDGRGNQAAAGLAEALAGSNPEAGDRATAGASAVAPGEMLDALPGQPAGAQPAQGDAGQGQRVDGRPEAGAGNQVEAINVQNLPQPASAQAPADQAPEAARGDGAAPAGVPDQGGAAAAVEATGVTQSKTVKLYRGVQKGQEGQPTVGGALFMSPDRTVAENYAGQDGAVSETERSFDRLLDAKTWADAKDKLGLPRSATMEEIVNAARSAGHDGVTFTTTNGREYIVIDQNRQPAQQTSTIPSRADLAARAPLPKGDPEQAAREQAEMDGINALAGVAPTNVAATTDETASAKQALRDATQQVERVNAEWSKLYRDGQAYFTGDGPTRKLVDGAPQDIAERFSAYKRDKKAAQKAYEDAAARLAGLTPQSQPKAPEPVAANPVAAQEAQTKKARQPNGSDTEKAKALFAKPVPESNQTSAITADDVAAAEKQAAQMISDRIDGMKAVDVQRIAARYLPTVGVKVPVGKARIKAAMTDAAAMNLLGPAGELGIELSDSVKRALTAKMEGRVGEVAAPVAAKPEQQKPQAEQQRTEYPFGRVANGEEDRFFQSRVRVLPDMKGDTAWEGEVGSILNGGRLIEVKRDGQDFRVRIPGDRIEVLDLKDSKSTETRAVTPIDRFEELRANGTSPDPLQNGMAALRKVAGRAGESTADFASRYIGEMGSQKIGTASGKEVLAWMEGTLIRKAWDDQSIPGANVKSISRQATAAYWRDQLDRYERDAKSFNDFLAKMDQRTFDVESMGGSAERIAQAREAIQEMNRKADQNKRELDAGLKAAEAREQAEKDQEEAESNAKFKPADLKDLEKKPTPASITGWSNAVYQGDPAWTNGHLVDLVSEPHLSGWQDRMNALRKDAPPLDAGRVVPKSQGTPLKLVGIYDNGNSTAPVSTVYLESNGRLTALNRNYYRYFASKFKGAEFHSHGETQPVTVHLDGRMVGLLMPINLGRDGIKLEEVKAKIAANLKREQESAKDAAAAEFDAQTQQPAIAPEVAPTEDASPYTSQQIASAYAQAESAIRGKTWSSNADNTHKGRIRLRLKDMGMSEQDAQALLDRAATIQASEMAGMKGAMMFLRLKDLQRAAIDRGLVAKPAADPAPQPVAQEQPAAPKILRRDPTKVNLASPYEVGDTVTIAGQDWAVGNDTSGWYLTTTGNWRGAHPTIRNIQAMTDLIREVERAAITIPEGYRPAGEFYYEGKLIQSYGPFIPGERVTMKDAAGQSGVVENLMDPDANGITQRAEVKFDNGTILAVPFSKLTAEKAAATAETAPTGPTERRPKLTGTDRYQAVRAIPGVSTETDAAAQNKVVDYLNGDISRTELMDYLADSNLPEGKIISFTQRMQDDGPSQGEIKAMLERRKAKPATQRPTKEETRADMDAGLRAGTVSVEDFMKAAGLTDDDTGPIGNGLREQAERSAQERSPYHQAVQEVRDALSKMMTFALDAASSTPQQRKSKEERIAKINRDRDTLEMIARKYEHPFDNNYVSKLSPILRSRFKKKFDEIQTGFRARDAFYQDSYNAWAELLIEAADKKAGVKPAAKATEDKPAGKVENFGEQLPPARRVMAAKLSESLDDNTIAAQPLSKIWPLEENEAIEDTFAAAVAHVMREAIPAKPRKGYKLNGWVEKVKMLREFAARILRGGITKEAFLDQMGKYSTLRDMQSKVKLLEQIDRANWKRIGEVAERPNALRFENGNSVPSPSVSIAIDGKPHWLRNSGDLNDHMEAIKSMLQGDAPETRMKFEIRQERGGKVFINKAGDKQFHRLLEFDTVAEARKAMDERYADLVSAWNEAKSRENITERDLRTAENRPRTGKDHRSGRDITAEEFQQQFGFRGGEFGKWVSQGNGAQERQFMLNSAYDALMDLADIVGVPPKAISLNGTLGIAFGSRGGGWASAHFEPSNLVINLTKPRGAGALAHEWFHALDNYFARQRNDGKETMPSTFGPGAQDAYRRSNYITHKTGALMVRKDGKGSPVTKARLEEWRKTNPNSGYLDPDQWMLDPKHPHGVRVEVEERFNALVNALDNSPMLQRSRSLEGTRGDSDGYWSRPLERAARAFENYVQHRMHEQGYHNDFLVNVKPAEDTGKNPNRYPYLMPSEMAPIIDAFNDLFSTVETRETDKGVAMFSRSDRKSPGLTATETQSIADAIAERWANAPEIVVAADMNDAAIPQAVRDYDAQQRSLGAKGDPEGFWYDGKVYLVAKSMASPSDVMRVLFHESLGHYGLRGVFGKALDPILNQIAALRRADVQAKADEYGLDLNKPDERLQAAEEVLSVMAQTKPELGYVKRAIAAIRSWMRRTFPKLFGQMKLTDAEIIRDYILPARGWVERGPGGGPNGGLPALSRGTPDGMAQEKPLTEKQFYRTYYQHRMLRGPEDVEAIMRDGWQEGGIGPNVLPAYRGGEPSSILERRYMLRAGDTALLIPKEGVRDTPNGPKVKAGWKPRPYEIVQLTSDGPAMYQEYLQALKAWRDSQEDAPRFSRAAAAKAYVAPAMDKLNETFNHPGKLSWWHKTVGSMYNLAERMPAFKPVYDAAQNFINDVSFYAIEAADKAPKLLPRLEDWKDLAKSPITAQDNKAVAAPVFEGTLSWRRDESGKPVLVEDLAKRYASLTPEQKAQRLLRANAISENVLKMWQGMPKDQYESSVNTAFEGRMLKAGIVFTPDELKSIFKLNDAQVALYQEFRQSIDTSLDNMGKSDLLRVAGKDAADLRDAVMSAPDVDAAAVLLRDHLLELAKEDPDRSDALVTTANDMITRAEKVQRLKLEGYAPLSRFGQYTVDVVVDGERQYFSMFETARDANRMAAKLKMEYGAENVAQGTLSQREFEMLQGITPESLELFGNMLGLDSTGNEAQDQVFQEYLKRTKANRSAMKRLIHRKGIAGYSEDVGRVLAAFVYSNARQTSAALHMGDLGEAVMAIPKGEGELKDAAVELARYVKEPREEAAKMRGWLFAQYLGGSIASAIVNFTQPLTTSAPYLSQFGGMGKSVKALYQAMADLKDKKFEAGLAESFRKRTEDGTLAPQGVHELMAQSRGEPTLHTGDGTQVGDALAKGRNAVAKAMIGWGKLFGMAEQINRQSTYVAAYRMAVERGMADPDAFAKKAVDETQFVNNKANKMKFGRGAIGATLMTFKSYSLNWLELFHRLATQNGREGKMAAAWMLGVLLLSAGASGLPFAEDAEDLADFLAQRLGYNWSSKKARQEFLESLFGRDIAGFVENGVTGLPGAPIDVSGRLGMGNMIPGTGLFLSKKDHTSDFTEVLGPAGDLAKRAFQAGDLLLSGNVGQAALMIAPKAIGNLEKGVDMAATGMYRDARGYKVDDATTGEAIGKAIGFQPRAVAQIQEASGLNQRAKDFYRLKVERINAKWAKAIFEKDAATVDEVRAEIKEWNRQNPDQRIKANIPAILRRVKEMRKTKAERIADTAPKALRASMREEVRRMQEEQGR